MYFLLDYKAISRPLLTLNVVLAFAYLAVLGLFFPRGNPYLFWALMIGEFYHIWQIMTYIYTIWSSPEPQAFDPEFSGAVDIFITVCGEPVEVVEETALAALAVEYENKRIFLLNDGYVAKKENWKDIEVLAEQLGINCITRKKPGGAKAGNINHALAKTGSPFVIVFDADHAPRRDFLQATIGYFTDPKVAFVQSPQYYRNHNETYVSAGAWEQQELFFGTICPGKQRMNAVFMCGTNMVIRRSALEQVGGIDERSITEDFMTSQYIHALGWRSVYVPKVLAQGLAPEDLLSYTKQQFRWARGSIQLLLRYNPLFRKGLTFAQKIQYLASSSFYLSGLVVLMNAVFPLVFFYTGAMPFKISTMLLAVVFLPYIFLTVYILRRSTGYHYTYRALAFSMGAFMIHIQALISALFGLKTSFVVTSKTRVDGNFTGLVAPHLLYIAAVVVGVVVAVLREGFDASVVANLSWATLNVALFIPFILAAIPSLGWLARPQEAEDATRFASIRKNL